MIIKKLKQLTVLIIMFLGLVSCSNDVEKITTKAQGFASSELGAVEYTVTKNVVSDNTFWYSFGDRKIVFSVKATLKAGLDLDSFCDENVIIEGKNVTLNLPKPKLISLDMKPDDTKLEYEKVDCFRSNFSAEDRNKILQLGEESIRKSIETIGIIEDAEENARGYLTSFLKMMGYNEITINFI